MKYLRILKTKYFLILALGLILAVYHTWIFELSILTKGDWGFLFKETLTTLRADYFSLWLSDSNFGRILIDVGQALTYAGAGALGKYFGMDWASIERVVYFLPTIFISVFSSYLLIKYFFKNDIAAFIGSVVYSFNTYTLTLQTGHLTLATAFAFGPLVFYLFHRALNEKTLRYIILAALVFFIASSYEPRAAYILAIILFFYGIWHLLLHKKSFIRESIPVIGVMMIFILLNFYWLFGLTHISNLTDQDLLTRGLWGSQYYDITKAFTLFHPWWTGSEIIPFENQSIPFYFFFIPFIAFLGLLIKRRNHLVLFFGCLSLFGIILTKQEALPFPFIYPWLFEHLPGFNAFREASKFYFIIVLGYSVLISAFIAWMWDEWKNKWIGIAGKTAITFFIAFLFLWNTKPFITGEINSLFTPRYIPNDYLIFKDYILSENKYSRTLWIPRDSQWGIYTDNHSKLSAIDLVSDKWENFIKANPLDTSSQYEIINFFTNSYSSEILSSSVVKYVIVPLQDTANDDDFFIDYGGRENPNIRQWYIDQLDSLPYLKRVDIGTAELVIYENENYLPYIRTTNSITQYESFANLNDKYKFTKDTLNLPFDFTVPKENKILFPTTRVTQPYDKITFKNLSTNALTEQLNSANSSYRLYTNTSNRVLSYKNEDGIIQFQSSYTPSLTINSQIIDQSPTTTILSKILVDAKSNYIAKTGSRIIHLKENNDWQVINTKNKQLGIFEISTENALPNGSFEEGLWQENVSDCNNFDELPILGMTRSEESTRGLYSLELSATRHIACTNTNITDLESGEEYLFSFEYKGKSAEQAGFYLSFNESTTTVISEKLPIPGYEWQRYERVVRTPKNITNPNLSLYAYSTDEETNKVVLYDDIQIRKISKIEEINLQSSNQFIAKPLPSTSEENLFSFSDSSTKFSNGVINGNLASGLWKKEVGDCHNYDEYSDIDMRLVTNSKDSSPALELEATRHNACTGPTSFPVIEGKTYLLTFDYQSDDKTEAGFNIGWRGTTTPAINEQIQIKDSSWQTFDKQITVPDGASSASLLVYAYENDGTTPIKVRYDNFSFIELPDIQNRYYLVSDPQTNFVEPREITFDLINPTKKLVHIKGATTPFYLAMSESFHPQWQAQFNNEKVNGFLDSWVPFVKPYRVRDEHHFELNGFLNGWYIDTTEYCQNNNLCTKNSDGSYDLELVLEFFPQRWFYLGLLISGTTLFGCISYLIYDFIRRRRNKVTLNSAGD